MINHSRRNKLFQIVASLVVLLGIALRLTVYFQNRDFVLDEVNLVRNLNERSFSELLQPLSYNQYAPVPFILVSKLSFSLLGAYEQSVRLFPFICGCIALFLFYKLLRRLSLLDSGLYALLIIATGLIYVRYSTEFKQYASDQLFTLGLLIAVFRNNIGDVSRTRFVLVWSLLGSAAIWFSMPSVFVLAGVGSYFLVHTWKSKQLKSESWTMVIVFACWISQFIINYLLFLRKSIGSEYLQNWHRGYFLNIIPNSASEWTQNFDALAEMWSGLGGHWVLSFVTNLYLFALGGFYLLKKRKSQLLLFALPIMLMLFAAGLRIYTLLPRVCLFAYPLMLIVISYGWKLIITSKINKVLIPLFSLSCLITIINFNSLKQFIIPVSFEPTTANLQWVKSHGVNADNTYIHELSWPQINYLATIRPGNYSWSNFKDAQQFYWYSNTDSLVANIHKKSAFVFSWIDEVELVKHRAAFYNYAIVQDSIISPERKLYILWPKE